MSFTDGLEFLTDDRFDNQVKASLLQGVLEQRRVREAAERKRWWHNSPLVLAIVGIVSVLASGAVAYIQANRAASSTITLKELDSKLNTQTTVLTAELAKNKAASDAALENSKRMQDFEYKIMEKLLDKSDAERANVLLPLVRAGMLIGLNQEELKKMAAPLNIEGAASQVGGVR
jgi:hypothetical protein